MFLTTRVRHIVEFSTGQSIKRAGLYTNPTSKNITDAFASVKDAIRLGVDVDAVSKQLVEQAVKFDIASPDYMFKIEGVGPVLERLGSRVFRLYEETPETASAL